MPTKKVAIHVFLDTNALFTEAADRLLATEISEFIQSSADDELNTNWHLPSVVVGERRFQMNERAKRLLPQLEKVEKLLGHNLGITLEVLSARVDDAIKRQIEIHKLNELNLNHEVVDWRDMVERSIMRKPPFDAGEKEKGFRDAIVLETLSQHLSTLPKSSQVCRIIFLSSDQRLVAAARERLGDRTNIEFANDLEAVKTILNAYASKITQDTVKALLPQATKLFFESDNEKTLYYSEQISRKIRAKFPTELAAMPPNANTVQSSGISISIPTFLVKDGQRITFATRVTFRMEGTRFVQRSKTPSLGLLANIGKAPDTLSRTAGLNLGSGDTLPTGAGDLSIGTLLGNSPPQFDEIKQEGSHVFEVRWSATLTAKGKLTRPKLIAVDYKSTDWKE